MLSLAHLAPSRRPEGYEAFVAEARLLISSAWRPSAREAGSAPGAGSADLYWALGRLIASHQLRLGWRGVVLQMLSEDLRQWFPGAAGLSSRNLQYMRAFAAAWPEGPRAAPGIACLPWGHITLLLDKVPDPARRKELAAEALRNGWSRTKLQERLLGERHKISGGQPGVYCGGGEDLIDQEG
jgi:hypothetical protein